jgi:hypothetical protein
MDLRTQLRCAIGALQLRGLKVSAKWGAEQLAGLEPAANVVEQLSPEMSTLLSFKADDASDNYLLAKTFFDDGEFQRAAFALQPSADFDTPGGQFRSMSGEEVFLKAYALFLAGEKAKEQETLELGDALERTKVETSGL